MLENLRGLAVFATVVERGSFRAAARALQLAPSVVSHHVRTLETELGVPMLNRTTRRLALTAAGEQVFAGARDMVQAAHRGLDSVARSSASPHGELRMTAPAILVETRFIDDVAELARRYPAVRLTVRFSESRHDVVGEGLDLALRIGSLADSSLRRKRIAAMERVLVAAPHYLAGRRLPRRLTDLADWDFVRLVAIPPELEMVPPHRTRPQRLAVKARFATDSAHAMRALVLAGVGIAALPAIVARGALDRGQLVQLLPDWRMTPRDVFALWPAAAARPELTEVVLRFLAPRLHDLFEPRAPLGP